MSLVNWVSSLFKTSSVQQTDSLFWRSLDSWFQLSFRDGSSDLLDRNEQSPELLINCESPNFVVNQGGFGGF